MGRRTLADNWEMTIQEFKEYALRTTKEKDWHLIVEQFARIMGWTHYHTYDSRKSDPGFPDLVLIRDDRLIFVELKAQRGKLSPDQERWQELIYGVAGACPAHVSYYCWKPENFDTMVEALVRPGMLRRTYAEVTVTQGGQDGEVLPS